MVQRAYMLNWTRVNQPAVPKDRHTQNFGQVYTQQVGNGSWACVKIWAFGIDPNTDKTFRNHEQK